MKYFLQFILVLMSVTFLFQTGYACMCMPDNRRSVENDVTNTDYLFVGKVTKIREETVSSTRQTKKVKKFFITFKINQNIKGVKDKEITVIQYKRKRELPCSRFVSFKKKKKYLVIANLAENKEIRVNNTCGRTKRLKESQGKYKKLLALKKLKPELF